MTNLLTLTPAEFCAATDVSMAEHRFALRYATMAEVWDAYPKPDWLLRICESLGKWPDSRTLRLFAIWCARQTPIGDGFVTGDCISDPRCIAALYVAERYAEGRASYAELRTAHAAAVRSSCASATGARLANWAACEAARPHVSRAAGGASFAAAIQLDAGEGAASAAQADQFRRMVPNPFRA